MLKKVFSFKKNDNGAAGVEFALVGLPFIFLLLGLFEISIMFIADDILQSATATAARQVKTGEIIGNDSTTEDEFIDSICAEIVAVTSCGIDNISVTVTNLDDADNLETFMDDGELYENHSFDTGNGSNIAIIRVELEYQLLTPLIAPIFSDLPDNKRLLMATTMVTNEPY